MKNSENIIISTVTCFVLVTIVTAFVINSFLPIGLLVVIGLGFTVSTNK